MEIQVIHSATSASGYVALGSLNSEFELIFLKSLSGIPSKGSEGFKRITNSQNHISTTQFDLPVLFSPQTPHVSN